MGYGVTVLTHRGRRLRMRTGRADLSKGWVGLGGGYISRVWVGGGWAGLRLTGPLGNLLDVDICHSL
jgi:hypothetical protein